MTNVTEKIRHNDRMFLASQTQLFQRGLAWRLLSCVFVILITTSLLSGCKNRGSTANPSLFLDHQLTQKLPLSAGGFFFVDFKENAFQKYRKYLAAHTATGSSLSQRLDAALRDSGNLALSDNKILRFLLSFSEKYSPITSNEFSNLMFFWDVPQELSELGAGLYAEIANGKVLLEDLKQFRKALEAEGTLVEELTGDFLIGYKITPQIATPASGDRLQASSGKDQPLATPQLDTLVGQGNTNSLDVPAYIAVSKTMFSVASSEKLLRRAFLSEIPKEESGAKRIKQLPSFKRVQEEYRGDQQFAFMFGDLQSLRTQLLQLIGGTAAANESQDLLSTLEYFPISTITMRGTYDEMPGSDIGVLFDEHAGKNKKTLSILAERDSSSVKLGATPKQAVFYISLAGRFFRALEALAEESLPESNVGSDNLAIFEQMKAQMQSFGKVSEVSLGLLPAEGSSFFPSLIGSISSDADIQALIDNTKGALSENLKQLPITKWNQKTVKGTSVDFLLSPLGVGIYLAAHGRTLLFSTSEYGIEALLSIANNREDSLTKDSLPRAIQSRSESSPLVFTYFNSEQAVNVIESAEGALAMFTQGQPLLSSQQMKDLRSFGTNFTVTSYRDGFLNFSTATKSDSE